MAYFIDAKNTNFYITYQTDKEIHINLNFYLNQNNEKKIKISDIIIYIRKIFLLHINRYIADNGNLFLHNTNKNLKIHIKTNSLNHVILFALTYYTGHLCYYANLKLVKFECQQFLDLSFKNISVYLYKSFFIMGYKDSIEKTDYLDIVKINKIIELCKKKIMYRFKELINKLPIHVIQIIFNFFT